jgi:hypothetical protein
MPEDSLDPYRELVKTVGPKIGLRTPIRVAPSERGWFFDQQPDKRAITIYVPPYSAEYTAPTFVHYLGHAKLLQDGWPRMRADISVTDPDLVAFLSRMPAEERQKIPLYWASRSEDSFFDFYVWLFLREQLGTGWLERFQTPVTSKRAEDVLVFFGTASSDAGTDVFRYLYCLDWFAAQRTLAEIHGFKVGSVLDAHYRAILGSHRLTTHFSQKIRSTLPWVRTFYRNMYLRYPSHHALLRDKRRLQDIFQRYYTHVWQDIGLQIAVHMDWPNP